MSCLSGVRLGWTYTVRLPTLQCRCAASQVALSYEAMQLHRPDIALMR
jgi:hypothetical protein